MRKLFEELDNTSRGQMVSEYKVNGKFNGVKWTGMLGLFCGGKIAEGRLLIIHGYEVSISDWQGIFTLETVGEILFK
jgi:hypothetical protein